MTRVSDIGAKPWVLRHRDEERRAVEGTVRHRDNLRQRGERARRTGAPAGDAHAPHLDVLHHRVGRAARHHEHRQCRGMVGALDERQPCDDLRCAGEFERRPPGAGARRRKRRHQAEIAFGFRHGLDHAGGAEVGHERHREAEMKARRVAHVRIARRQVGMDRERRLHVREGRDDDAPDAFRRVERQQPAMALDQAAHHLGLARRTERGAGLLGALDRDQALDDLAALHEQAVHRLVDAVDLAPQVGERGRVAGGERLCHGGSSSIGDADGKARNQRKH